MRIQKNIINLRIPDKYIIKICNIVRIFTAVLVLLNLIEIGLMTKYTQYTYLVLTTASAVHIVLTLVFEPYTYKKYPKINYILNLLMGLCCGLIFLNAKTYISIALFFTDIILINLRFETVQCILFFIYYYAIYFVPVVYSSEIEIGTIIYDGQIFVVLFAIAYFSHYVSNIKYKNIKKNKAIVNLLNQKMNLTYDLQEKNKQMEIKYWEMVETLMGMIDAKDDFTGSHCVKVCEYSVKLAQKLKMSDIEIKNIMKASILHDIGKIGIPDNILLKPGKLSDKEFNIIKRHPEIGCKILTKAKVMESIIPMILCHHERIDGKGYPKGLKGENIPSGAKIIAIADAYDAMTSNRPYRKSLAEKEARDRLIEGSGTQFDGEFVNEFIELLDRYNFSCTGNYKCIENIKRYVGVLQQNCNDNLG